jgi:hypothetical protein
VLRIERQAPTMTELADRAPGHRMSHFDHRRQGRPLDVADCGPFDQFVSQPGVAEDCIGGER